MSDYEQLSLTALKTKLKEKQELYEEVEEERCAVVSQTNIHLPGSTLGKYLNELKQIEAKIDELKALIKAKETAEKNA